MRQRRDESAFLHKVDDEEQYFNFTKYTSVPFRSVSSQFHMVKNINLD